MCYWCDEPCETSSDAQPSSKENALRLRHDLSHCTCAAVSKGHLPHGFLDLGVGLGSGAGGGVEGGGRNTGHGDTLFEECGVNLWRRREIYNDYISQLYAHSSH